MSTEEKEVLEAGTDRAGKDWRQNWKLRKKKNWMWLTEVEENGGTGNKLDLNELEHEVDNEQLDYKLDMAELFKDDESDEQLKSKQDLTESSKQDYGNAEQENKPDQNESFEDGQTAETDDIMFCMNWNRLRWRIKSGRWSY